MADNKVKFLRGTSAEYKASPKDKDTFYYTTDTKKLYLGETEITSIEIDDTSTAAIDKTWSAKKISDSIPTTLPANGGNASTVNNHTVKSDVPENAKFTDTVYTHPTSGVTAGTYKSVTVDNKGHVTAGSNPTTLAGYGITDAAAKSHTHDDRYYTESEINTKLNAKLNTSLKGAASGLAELDANGKVPSAQLPSYVDDVLEYTAKTNFPSTGETGKIYVDTTTNKTYRWSGSTYTEISASIALGETSSTAYRGDRGKIAYDHSQTAHAPSNAEANVQADWNVTNTASDAYIKNKPTSLPANGGNATKVTAVGNHYTPSGGTTTSASGGTLTDITNSSSGVQVVTGVTKDAAGHVTGVTSVALKSVNTNTTYSNFVKSGSGAKSGLVPAPSTTAGTTKYLCEDGTWKVPTIPVLTADPKNPTDGQIWIKST